VEIVFEEEKPEEIIEEEENEETQQTKQMPAPRGGAITIDPVESDDFKNTFFRLKLFDDGKPDDSDGKLHLVPIVMKEYTDEMQAEDTKKKEPLWFRWVFPVSTVINIFLVFLTGFLGMWQPFMVTLLFSVGLMALIFFAGENFWLWIQVAINKKKNWAMKLRSYATSRKTLTFQPIQEIEKFLYIDKGGKKRYSETHIRKLDSIHNLGLSLAIIREGYPNNISIEDNYPFSQLNRQIDQDNDMAFAAGTLSISDELMDFIKNLKRGDTLLYLILGAVVIALFAVIYMISQQPDQIATALKTVMPAAQTTAQTIADVNKTAIQVAVP
jgi:hypothetical protein